MQLIKILSGRRSVYLNPAHVLAVRPHLDRNGGVIPNAARVDMTSGPGYVIENKPALVARLLRAAKVN